MEVVQQASSQGRGAANVSDPILVRAAATAQHTPDAAELKAAQAARQCLVEAPTLSSPKKRLTNTRVEPREAGSQRCTPPDQEVTLAVPGAVPCQQAVLETGLRGTTAVQGDAEDDKLGYHRECAGGHSCDHKSGSRREVREGRPSAVQGEQQAGIGGLMLRSEAAKQPRIDAAMEQKASLERAKKKMLPAQMAWLISPRVPRSRPHDT